MRDNKLLEEKLEKVWERHFGDLPQTGAVNILFGRKARKRLGSIREVDNKTTGEAETKILINGYFIDESIPDFIIEATIAHELCHYAHGFGSPLPQLFPYPHRGGKVDREMQKRGLLPLAAREDRWLSKNWFKYLNSHKN